MDSIAAKWRSVVGSKPEEKKEKFLLFVVFLAAIASEAYSRTV
jgi:hypothetical protein